VKRAGSGGHRNDHSPACSAPCSRGDDPAVAHTEKPGAHLRPGAPGATLGGAQTAPRIRIAIVDPSIEIRAAILALVNDRPGLEIGEVASSLAGLQSLRGGTIDALIADIRACTGAEGAVLQALRELHPAVRLIVTSTSPDPEYAEAAAGLAASAWIPKARLATELLPALHRIMPH
jgi:DNA-binding NtrC family response regulator